MNHRHRQLGAAVLATGCALTIAACGSSSKSSTDASASPSASGGAARTGLTLTTTQRACLKKHGVTLPTGGAGGFHRGVFPGDGRGADAKRPAGATRPKNGTFPKGKRPPFGAGHGGFAHSSATRTALKDCGVTVSGPRAGAAPGAGTTGAQ